MKSYTDLEQSKKLAVFLPTESADMIYPPMMDIDSMSNSGFFNIPECYPFNEFKDIDIKPLPCWSLSELLSVLDFPSLTQNKEDEWEVCIPNHKSEGYIEVSADNPIDACVEMIIKLHEEKLL